MKEENKNIEESGVKLTDEQLEKVTGGKENNVTGPSSESVNVFNTKVEISEIK